MWVVVGLGNPGPDYEGTRHNVGYMVAERLVADHCPGPWRDKFEADVRRCRVDDTDVLFVRPRTYMNLSGRSVSAALRYFKAPVDRLVVVHDDLDQDLGRLKIVTKGGSGGHKGVDSIAESLGTDVFLRLKVGIGRPRYSEPVEEYVLGAFYSDQRDEAGEMISRGASAVEMLLLEGPARAMTRYHGRLR